MRYAIQVIVFVLFGFLATACVSEVDDRGLPPNAGAYERPAQSETEPTPEPAYTAPHIDVPPPADPLPPIRVWLHPEINDPDEVRAGIAAWAYVFQGVRDFTFVEATPEDIVDADMAGQALADVSIWEIGPYGGTCNPDPEHADKTLALGCVHGIGGAWDNRSGESLPLYLITPNDDRNVKQTTMHEFGHLLGLTHRDGGLMWGPAPNAVLDSDWECPDVVSVDRIAAKFDLDRASLHSCALPPAVAELVAKINSEAQ